IKALHPNSVGRRTVQITTAWLGLTIRRLTLLAPATSHFVQAGFRSSYRNSNPWILVLPDRTNTQRYATHLNSHSITSPTASWERRLGLCQCQGDVRASRDKP